MKLVYSNPQVVPANTSSCEGLFGIFEWHRWGAWKVIESGNQLSHGKIIGRYIWQQRTCKDCGKSELNEQRT